jgi:hypothetical protein
MWNPQLADGIGTHMRRPAPDCHQGAHTILSLASHTNAVRHTRREDPVDKRKSSWEGGKGVPAKESVLARGVMRTLFN